MGHYETLGVSKNATDSEIKKRYRELARELHPDLNHNDKSASENFKKINDAYDVLSDKKSRAKKHILLHRSFFDKSSSSCLTH